MNDFLSHIFSFEFSLKANSPKYPLDNIILHTITNILVFEKPNISFQPQIYFTQYDGLPLFLLAIPLIS